ncbi:MAG: 1-(5-phosphoribosyl)-5-amino-4-imidazole-carboxylate carboxylase [Chloroflexi bacterium]|nr:1-(5-phosphoribosyl)-5-amino-4-imidazole-carboxylate carboxylase [Chloroflexota bacterium]
MDTNKLKSLLEEIKSGSKEVDEGVKELVSFPYEDLEFAKVDHHREIRQGFPEVVFGQGKTPHQIKSICESILKRSGKFVVTRASGEAYKEVIKSIPEAIYDTDARVITVTSDKEEKKTPGVTVICAGTSDLPVATEAALTAETMGCDVHRIHDVGVAGIHRLFDQLEVLQSSKVIVAVAGMEGALPSVIGGLVSAPIIAVPTSIGYGASFGGIAALLSMLNSCAPGISVVNIDNGFGAGYIAANIVLSHNI